MNQRIVYYRIKTFTVERGTFPTQALRNKEAFCAMQKR